MKRHTHVRTTIHSGHSTLGPLSRALRESFTTGEDVYRVSRPAIRVREEAA